jgi:hypothetical protein
VLFNYTATIMLRQPLHPQLLENHWSQPTPTTPAAGAAASEAQPAAAAGSGERMLTLHLHTFVYGKPAKKRKPNSRKNNTASSSSAAAAVGSNSDTGAAAEAYGAAEAALLAAVVGSDAALAALPAGPSVEGGMRQQQPEGRLCFGVLLWQPLPKGLMQWPAWIQRKLYVVSVHCC